MLSFMGLSLAAIISTFIQGLQESALENFVEFNTNKSLFGIPIEPAMLGAFDSFGVIIFGLLLAISPK
ncbi:MAG: hypothetical protein Kow0076_6640 [Francisella sp.]